MICNHRQRRRRHAPLHLVLLVSAILGPLCIACPAAADVVQLRIRKNVMMPARDGVRLATDVYLPDGEVLKPGPFPAILIRTPYNKSGAASVAELFTTRSYAVAVQDVCGRYASEGAFYIYVNEGEDGYDAVGWVTAQPWCNGDVGTYGGSYLAATQNALASLNPPNLKTMFVVVGTSNYIEYGAGRDGVFAILHNASSYGFRLAQTAAQARVDESGRPAPPRRSARHTVNWATGSRRRC